MKKLIIVYIVLIIAVILLAVFKFGGNITAFNFFKSPQAEINGTKIELTLAKSEKDRMKGLSGRKSLEQNKGMLFVFDQKAKYGFWMKEMLFPIDIIYIDDDSVVYIAENATPPAQAQNLKIYEPPQIVNYVLEVNAGTAKKLDIHKGTKVKFTGVK